MDCNRLDLSRVRQATFAVFAGLLVLGLSACGSSHSSGLAPIQKQSARTSFESVLSHSRDLGLARSGSISITLKLRQAHASRGQRAVAAMYRPGSASYGKFARAGALVKLFGAPSRSKPFRTALASLGLHLAGSPSGPFVTVSGPVALIDHLFGVSVHDFNAPHVGRFQASRRRPSLPTKLRRFVARVGDISTYPLQRAAIPGGGLTPGGISSAYDIAALQQAADGGAGETVVFVEIDGYETQAMNAFASKYGLPPFDVTLHGPALKGGDESTMDLEVVHAIAPKAKLVVYDFPSRGNWVAMTDRVVRANRGAVLSESLGLCESSWGKTTVSGLNNDYAHAAALGESVFVSTGDNAAFGCLNYGEAPSSQYVGIQAPSACPYVTAVGGTRISVRSNGSWYDESPWEDPIETGGTGGGASSYFAQPSWQKAPGVALQDSANNPHQARMVPDVSADADPTSGMAINWTEGWGQGGGTSQAAPIWAAITALTNGYLKKQGLGPVGWANPALYKLASSKQAYPPFHDVTVGSNLWYPAAKGFDMATGIGTPDAWNLARDLRQYEAGNAGQ